MAGQIQEQRCNNDVARSLQLVGILQSSGVGWRYQVVVVVSYRAVGRCVVPVTRAVSHCVMSGCKL